MKGSLACIFVWTALTSAHSAAWAADPQATPREFTRLVPLPAPKTAAAQSCLPESSCGKRNPLS